MSVKHVICSYAYDQSNRLICIAFNSYSKSHSVQAKYAAKAGKPGMIYLHAEIHALIKAKNLGKKIHKIHVTRFTKDGQPAMAKPCPVCWAALVEHGVKKISYTTGEPLV